MRLRFRWTSWAGLGLVSTLGVAAVATPAEAVDVGRVTVVLGKVVSYQATS